ncbi:MAG TPA: MFS transporter [Solirubrobacteraceae bacterium]|nr:MFS transporter [Solirubrobacteraceae bacterium]
MSTGTIGVVLACATVGSIIGLLCARLLLHRLGGRGAVLATLAIVSCSLVVMGVGVLSRSIAVVGLGFVVVGFGLGALDVSINVEGAAVERSAGRTLMPLMHAAWSGGAALGSAIGALCAATGIGPAAQFLGMAVLVLTIGLLTSRDIPLAAPPEPGGQPSEPRAVRVRRWLHGWTDRRLLLIGLVLLGVEFGEGSANNWLALAVKDNHGQSGALAALFLTIFAISEATARTFGGPLVDRFGRVRVLRCATALGVAGVSLFILSHVIWLVALGVVLWAIGVSMGFPLGMSAAAEGDDPAARVSVAASVGYFASLLGPPLIGFLAESVGLLGALWSLAILFVAAFVAGGSLRPARVRSSAA